MLRLEQMQALLKTEPEEADDEIVDIVTVTPPCQKLKVKEEEQEADAEPKFYLGPCTSAQFVSETAQQVRSFSGVLEVKMQGELMNTTINMLLLFCCSSWIFNQKKLHHILHFHVMSLRLSQIGVNFHPVEVEKNVFAPSVETMILKVGHYTGQNRGKKKKVGCLQ